MHEAKKIAMGVVGGISGITSRFAIVLILDLPLDPFDLVTQHCCDRLQSVQLARSDPAPHDAIQGRLGAVRRSGDHSVGLAEFTDDPRQLGSHGSTPSSGRPCLS